METTKIYEIIAEQCGMSADDISVEMSLMDDLGLDSLDLFQMIMSFEEEFNVEIPTEDANLSPPITTR